MTDYEKIEEFYTLHSKEFLIIEEKIYKYFSIPKFIISSTIKRRLHHIICKDGINSKFLTKKSIIFSLLSYWPIMIVFKSMSLLGKKSKNCKCKVAYEEWCIIGHHFNTFYNSIYNALLPSNQKIYATTKTYCDNFNKDMDVIQATHNFLFEKNICKTIFRASFNNYFKLIYFSIKYKFDFIGLYVRLIGSIARHETESKGLDIDFLISAHDNGYDAFRYFIYKKNGIKNIILIQNGLRGNNNPSEGSLYLYADFYLSYGKKQSQMLLGLHTNKTIHCGSFPLYQYFLKYENVQVDYDVILIEQITNIDFEKSFYMGTFLRIIDHLKRFADEYKNLKVAYRTRNARVIGTQQRYLPVDKKLIGCNVIFESLQSENSYEAVMKSKIVVTYCSSLGLEAVGLGKKVLFCNYDNLSSIPNQNSVAVTLSGVYEEFKDKLLYLLNSDYKNLIHCYSDLKSNYMNIARNPVDEIIDIINGS
ncbi:hypothetical protein [Campylobacter hyointestinalis]|uniref:hypothetical protein n=1 Tax=Campylobacter hyointestinalis TaxID=198 RepID=UPI000DCD7881|nr:hypothetical protein [Campylobacter hyointestinalis]RAZ44848.1 hypothetical protein CHL14416_09260 [Campylobacter hyointestinalis subsp. lawsonii]